MSVIIGYRIPGSTRGGVFTLPDDCYGLVGESDADNIAASARQAVGKEPTWQSVRGALIRLARVRRGCGRKEATS